MWIACGSVGQTVLMKSLFKTTFGAKTKVDFCGQSSQTGRRRTTENLRWKGSKHNTNFKSNLFISAIEKPHDHFVESKTQQQESWLFLRRNVSYKRTITTVHTYSHTHTNTPTAAIVNLTNENNSIFFINFLAFVDRDTFRVSMCAWRSVYEMFKEKKRKELNNKNSHCMQYERCARSTSNALFKNSNEQMTTNWERSEKNANKFFFGNLPRITGKIQHKREKSFSFSMERFRGEAHAVMWERSCCDVDRRKGKVLNISYRLQRIAWANIRRTTLCRCKACIFKVTDVLKAHIWWTRCLEIVAPIDAMRILHHQMTSIAAGYTSTHSVSVWMRFKMNLFGTAATRQECHTETESNNIGTFGHHIRKKTQKIPISVSMSLELSIRR